mmetsp:Transcript_34723/g.64045  ORF Transcript_34723/g.64045 Transcript_34723/m.64045 type:complete len:436 (-) Transcript_34723:95-1402(-)
MFRAYVLNFPMRIIRWMSRHGRQRGGYHVPRDIPPPEDLIERVFPFVDDLKEAQKAEFSQWRQEMIELLDFLAKVLLQDVAVIYDDIESVVKLVDPFTLPQFMEYRRQVLHAVKTDSSLDPSKFKSDEIELREMRAELKEDRAASVEWQEKVMERLEAIERKIGAAGTRAETALAAADASAHTEEGTSRDNEDARGGEFDGISDEGDGRTQDAPQAVPRQSTRGGEPAPEPASQERDIRRREQSPDAVWTWRPQEREMPPFASNYLMMEPTTMEAFLDEYLTGLEGRPALKLIEAHFGPERRGRMPSWRSKHVRGGSRRCDSAFAKRKVLYDLIDSGKTADDLLQIIREEKPELFTKPENLTNGKMVNWLIVHMRKRRAGYENRLAISKKALATKEQKRLRRKQAEDRGEDLPEDGPREESEDLEQGEAAENEDV